MAAQTQVSDSIIKAHVSALAHDSMKGRFTGRIEIDMAAGYIASQLDSIGMKRISGLQGGFLIPWTLKNIQETGPACGRCYTRWLKKGGNNFVKAPFPEQKLFSRSDNYSFHKKEFPPLP